jgi:hypothetical protein
MAKESSGILVLAGVGAAVWLASKYAASAAQAPDLSPLVTEGRGSGPMQKILPLDFSKVIPNDDFPVQPNYPALPPHLYQPTTGLPFNPTTYVTIPAIGATAIILDFFVPNGYQGVINQMGNNFVGGGFVDGSGNLVWQLLIDGVPYPNFEDIIASLGNPANPSLIGAVQLRERQHVQLVVENVAVVTAGQLIGGRLSGYYYPLDLADTTQWF